MTIKSIPNIPEYLATDDGGIWSIRSARFLRPWPDRGYCRVNLFTNGRRVRTTVHRLMALAFLPNPLGLPMVAHDNDIRNDNRLLNLKWSTVKDNSGDMIRNGHSLTGVTNHAAKLTERDIASIREMISDCNKTNKQIAAEFNVSHQLISEIKRKNVWRHI